MKPLPLFLSGSLLGVCVTVGVFYLRSPAARPLPAAPAPAEPEARATVVLRPVEFALGAPNAPATLIEYSDFQCPFCAMFRNETFPKLRARYIDTGKLRFIHRHLPLPSHSQAMPAARAAACAADQDKYWDLSAVFFSRTSCLDCQGPVEVSKAVPMDRQRFEKCVAENPHQPEIDQDIASAKQLNFNATPSFLVGRTTPKGVEGILFQGAMPYEEFQARIDPLLAAGPRAGR